MEIYGIEGRWFNIQLRCIKKFTNIKRDAVEKELRRLIREEEEIIRGWRKEDILETLRYIGIIHIGL